MPVRRTAISRILLAVYLLGLFVCCFWNFRSSIDLGSRWMDIPLDKAAHFFLFMPFPLICFLAFPKVGRSRKRLSGFIAVVFIAGTLMGWAIELIQGISGYRSKDTGDLLADCLGLAVSCSVILIIGLKSIRDKKC